MLNTLIAIAIIVVLFVFFYFAARAGMKKVPGTTDHQGILHLNDHNFGELTHGKVVLVDFWAEWCAPCRMMALILNEIAAELPAGLHVGKVNVDESQGLAQTFNVRNIPTMILFKEGKEVSRFVGIKPKDFLLREMVKYKHS